MGSLANCGHGPRNRFKAIVCKDTGKLYDAHALARCFGRPVYTPDVLTRELVATWPYEKHGISFQDMWDKIPNDPDRFTAEQTQIAKEGLGEDLFFQWRNIKAWVALAPENNDQHSDAE